MKAMLLAIANVFALLWQVVPERLRLYAFKALFVLESRGKNPRVALKRLFAIQDEWEKIVSERATALGGGEHPKHRLIHYHDFFIDRITDGQRVLDVGCGYGAVARSIARARPASAVTGLDNDIGRLTQARNSNNPANLNYVETDATKSVPSGPWDVVVLSNVLEHIADRIGFLKALVSTTGAANFLIRVPLFERDWKMPMRREVGANYYSDPDHKIEPTQAEFRTETAAAGLVVEELITPWGEIWASLKVANKVANKGANKGAP